ncbi:sarcosine oxidase subunit gamma [Constrictibacter sp. MBR-5]|jgi:sarcosine oxidase subunit gamma|uniref:sarcosine oxidase subunit gamma n=1 Tax=Constrictibacter sp. MBR-5 TaxID=3156467 RepID=UPI0033934BEE
MAETADIQIRRSPLQHRAEALAAASDTAASILEIPFQAQTVVRGDLSDSAFRARSTAALGYELPSAPNGTASDDRTTALWLGPDEWLVTGPDGSGADTRARLRESLAGLHAAVVDVGGSRTLLELRGPGARAALESVCVIDLHPRTFPPGRCAQTMIGPAQIILLMRNDAPTWWLFVRSSYADWLAAWLTDALKNSR